MQVDIFDIASRLTLTAALVGAIAALVLGVVVSAKTVTLLMAERDKREALIAAERDMWRVAAEAAQKQRDEADDRADRLAAAFEAAFRIIRGLPAELPPPSKRDGADPGTS